VGKEIKNNRQIYSDGERGKKRAENQPTVELERRGKKEG